MSIFTPHPQISCSLLTHGPVLPGSAGPWPDHPGCRAPGMDEDCSAEEPPRGVPLTLLRRVSKPDSSSAESEDVPKLGNRLCPPTPGPTIQGGLWGSFCNLALLPHCQGRPDDPTDPDTSRVALLTRLGGQTGDTEHWAGRRSQLQTLCPLASWDWETVA